MRHIQLFRCHGKAPDPTRCGDRVTTGVRSYAAFTVILPIGCAPSQGQQDKFLSNFSLCNSLDDIYGWLAISWTKAAMLRSELISAASRVRRALRLPHMSAAFRMTSRETPNIDQMLAAFREWFRALDDFSEAEKRIITFFDLDELAEMATWNLLLINRSTTPSESNVPSRVLNTMKIRTRQALIKIPQFIEMIQHDATIIQSPTTSLIPRLKLILPEPGAQFSTSTRIIEGLDSISTLYKALAFLSGWFYWSTADHRANQGADYFYLG